MIVNPDQEYRIQYKEGWSRQSGSASFGAIFEWSGSEFYELSWWILLAKPGGSNILHDISPFVRGAQMSYMINSLKKRSFLLRHRRLYVPR